MAEGIVEVKGKAFSLPEGAELIVVRAPADVQPEDLEGVELKDLIQDDPMVTKQIALAYYEGEDEGYRRVVPSKSYFLTEKPKESKPPKVVRLERPPMIPPTGLKLGTLPFSGQTVNSKSAKKSKKSRKSKEEKDDEEHTTSHKRRKESEDVEEPTPPKSKKKAKIRSE